ncbi:MAG: potassium-transporting ATPase subunit C [Nitrososphaerales archaeon]|jgi:K+-transporting ATPase ATPase C chain
MENQNRENDEEREGGGKAATTTKRRGDYRPVVGIAIVSLLVCGLFFPLLITGIAQVVLPYQANGEIVDGPNGQPVGSNVIAQNFTASVFFQPRANVSASGLDPDIPVQDALSQVPHISNATGIPVAALDLLVNSSVDAQGQAVELQYVNVLSLNLMLVSDYPSVYAAYR